MKIQMKKSRQNLEDQLAAQLVKKNKNLKMKFLKSQRLVKNFLTWQLAVWLFWY